MPEPRARRASLTQTGPRGPEFRLGTTYRACSSPDRAFASGPKGSRFDSCQAPFRPGRDTTNGSSRVSCPAVFLQHPLDQAIEPLGLVVDVGGQHTHAFVVRTLGFFYLLAQLLDPHQRLLELMVHRVAGFLYVAQHPEVLPAYGD